MSQIILYMYIITALFTSYCIARLCIKVRKPSVEQLLIIFGLGIVLAALVLDKIYYRPKESVVPFLHSAVMETAIVAFLLIQMTAMIFGTMRQAAEAREAEQRLAVENAALDRVNRLKTELMATISHEMSTPLAVMMGYAQLIVKQMKGADEQTVADLNTIASEAKRLSQIVDEMQRLTVAREFAEDKRPLSIEAVIRQIARLYAPILQRKHNLLALEIQDNLPQVVGNEDELIQVLFNPLTNAGKHTENGDVVIRADCIVHNAALMEVVVSVSDTGTGMPSSFLPRAFEKYRHGDEDGTGIGLAICQEIIAAHGGRIWLTSELGKGTVASFALPARDGENDG